MKIRQKKLQDQVIVITGASSGIGLATARLAARRGARVVLAARNEEALREDVERIRRDGGQAIWVVADVSSASDCDEIAKAAIGAFGGIDTWVNDAGVAIYGRLDEVHLEEKRRLFDVNFWGVVHGCRSALPQLKRRGGGTIINVGSVLSERAMPLQGMYSAAKHAVKAYTDALRMELEEAGIPIWVTLIKPGAINTPYYEHAVSHMGVRPKMTPPVYSADTVARAILAAAERPYRDIHVGGSGMMFRFFENFAPRLADRVMERTLFDGQKAFGRPEHSVEHGNLYHPMSDLDARVDSPVKDGLRTRSRSWFTDAALMPTAARYGLFLAATGLIGSGLWRMSDERRALRASSASPRSRARAS